MREAVITFLLLASCGSLAAETEPDALIELSFEELEAKERFLNEEQKKIFADLEMLIQ